MKGENGLVRAVGSKSNAGKIGPQGSQGIRGEQVRKGETGRKGEKGEVMTLNWKLCVWKRKDQKDNVLIQNCHFRRCDNNSALRIAYAGTLRVYCTSGLCCSRWYFTFNGNECSGPVTIEGVVAGYPASYNPHRHKQIEGYWENIPAGQITIGFNIENARNSRRHIMAKQGGYQYLLL